MITSRDAGFVYPKTGLDVDLRFDTTPTYVSTGSMFLDGTNDRLDCDGATWASTGAWTIACWIKCTKASTIAQLILSATDGSNTFDLYASGGAAANVHLHDGNSGQNIASNALIFDGTWHHLALTCGAGGGATATLYFDGQVQGTVTCTCDDLSSATTLHIGANTAGASTLAGNLAHFGIWESALSQASIRKLMTATTYAQVTAQSGATPVDYWLLEVDGSASVGQAGTLTNGAVIVGDQARISTGLDLTSSQLNAQLFTGRAVSFDGTGDQLTGTGPNIATAGAWSVSCWVKSSDTSTQYLVDANAPSSQRIVLYTNFSGNVAHWGTGDSSGTLLDGVWHHLVFTISGGTSATVYIDGKSMGTATVTSQDLSSISTLEISGAASNSINGSLSDVKIYSGTALSAAQVLEQCQTPELIIPTGVTAAHLVAWWPLSDYDISPSTSLDGVYFQDSTGNGNGLVAANSAMLFEQPTPCPQMGLRSNTPRCLFNDGNTVLRLSPSGTDIDCSGAFTYLFWVQTFTANTDARLLDANAGAGPVVSD